MANDLVVIDSKLDRFLESPPSEAIRLIVQEYQIAYDRPAFVMAMAAKLVVLAKRGAKC
ncbi:hypothetical protein [Herbaspirillum sp. VT-16-41]|uniref:hypothetical protein n=1 Tax=Herbaspirillum sp. VT-16-41 TaxID=1953765 RepID=UPI00143DBB3F|nr:hypothetical protein [Herbaspirillum sp. VT-16-41]